MGSSSMKLVVALIFSLLLLSGFSAEAARKINAEPTAITTEALHITCFLQTEEVCPGAKDCDSCCKSLGHINGRNLIDFCCCQEKQ
ncbi:hypothetical protein MKW94_027818 [Papaver nudicaule]|uniref:Uncharacterized protein n=1 Tax=Papaver nudicaule TaxID=74823 RepID=A0AA41VGW1_PAPNU|nr:hypothetical protein [Papaver nudicaule]